VEKTVQREIEGYARTYRLRMPERQKLFLAGDLAGKRTGSSIEYQDRKDYVPGDDPRHVDWRAFARTDRLTVKLYREEISPRVDIVVDTSRSMGSSPEKAGRAAQLAYFFHLLARHAQAMTRVHNLGSRITTVQHPDELERAEKDRVESPLPLLRTAPAMRRGGIKVVISDFLFPLEPRELRGVFRSADSVALVQLLATFEADPEVGGEWRLQDAETDQFLDIALSRPIVDGYRRRVKILQDELTRQMRMIGGALAVVRDRDTWDETMRSMLRSGILEV
jgi:uncharacterized protein (DUF58 family)